MSETGAIKPALETVRSVAEPNGHLAPEIKKKTRAPIATSKKQAPNSLELVQADFFRSEPLRTEDIGADEARAEAPRPETSGDVAPRTTELELKLLVDADRLADFNNAPIIAANARSNGTRKHLKAVYYDTPKRALQRNGLSFRVRQSGARFTQTVKADSANDPLRRGEWEASVPSAAPDIALALPFIPEKLRAGLDRRPLEAVFTTDIHRRQRIIDLPSGTVEVAFDQGFLKSGDRSMPVSEIELELKSGSASAIYELALRLAEHGPVRPSIRSKSARGFDLAADTPPTARRPRKLRLDPSASLDETFAAILRACLLHLLQSLPAAEDGRNPEGIHQLRVALRRLRSAMHLMQSVLPVSKLDLLRADAKWLGQNLSAAREWDVFQHETLRTVAQGCPSIAGFDALERAAEQHRTDSYDKARLALTDRRASYFVIGLGGWIEARGWRGDVAAEQLAQLAEPAMNFARRILSTQHAKVLKRGRRFKSLTAEELHRLRLAVKKLRYVADFLLPLYGQRKSATRFSDRLADLQHELGIYNDMAATASLLADIGMESASGSTAAAAIAGWQAHAMVGTEPRLRKVWSDFVKAKVPWSIEAEA
ncbi:CHAD domain-containing protein [Bradyrhizobium sp. CCGUVB1N3]|uniref:CYTH and CHAD domain-containing protein n=1 Tax=Bradyrhizobium sp. CCGUVB1N3 TaxID=2949629 RepID=UPI0020B29595|nr:CYTH and CHAD domain-containing protein [Bradyrhizobium sp. CCGUVB1N3]MCP3477399.1 CHAD domain-containing protein [Bradyrhizobium sp. CCGUVB1N3]